MFRKVLAASALLLLAGCAAEQPAPPPAPTPRAALVAPSGPAGTVSYTCENGTVVTVAWGQDMADVSYGGIQWVLPLARSASGARYADDTREIWEHQGVLRVTPDDGPETTCMPIR